MFSVPVITSASPSHQAPDLTRNTISEPILREHHERRWDLPNIRPVSDLLWTLQDGEIERSEISLKSGEPLDLVPSGTPHAPIVINNNSDFENQGWPGEGTVEQPYIIAGLEINATTGESAINITNTDVHFFIKDCRLTSNSAYIIELHSITHARITNNTVLLGAWGVIAFHSSDLTIFENEFYNLSLVGVHLEECSFSTVDSNWFTNCEYGLFFEQSEHCIAESNSLSYCDEGIYLYWNCERITVFNNTIQDSWDGIYVYLNCHDNIIDSNNCTSMEHIAILVVECSENTILNNFCTLNDAAIALLNCTSHIITGNDCSHSEWFEFSGSIALYNTNHSLVTKNHVKNASINIAMVNGSSYNEISNNNCSMYDGGIAAWSGGVPEWGGAPYNTIRNNTCNGLGMSQVDIFIELSDNCTVTENRCNQSEINIGVIEGDHTNITDNVCYESSEVSIIVMGSYYALVKDNILGNGSTGIVMDTVAFSSVLSNTVSNFTGSWMGLTGIHLDEFYNSSVEGNYVTECNIAIYVEYSEYSRITDNTCVNNYDGIVVINSNNHIIVDDNYCNQHIGYAIVVVESFNCSVTRNTCTNTSGGEGFSLLLGDCEADVSFNLLSLSTGGIEVMGCDGEITHNIIKDNEMFGITIGGIIGPNVTWNVFEDNGVNAIDDSDTAMFGYNYWSNYTGIDSNADGIGETWHPIQGSANNNDTHPLVYHPTPPVWAPELENQVTELGHDFEYVLSYTTSSDLAPIVDWWVNDSVHFAVDDGAVTNTVFLNLGEYTLEVRAINLYGFNLSGTFRVTVSDTIAPSIIGPDDFDYVVGQVGRSITWIPEDYDPESYSVTLNGIEVQSGAWNSTAENVTISVDGLSVGDHTFVVTFVDGSGNTATDTVVVTVRSDLTPLYITAGAGVAIIVVILVVYLYRKKGPGE
jgi:parallel beta-helix repeat protein